jgi:hypothetical protein
VPEDHSRIETFSRRIQGSEFRIQKKIGGQDFVAFTLRVMVTLSGPKECPSGRASTDAD